MNKYIDAEALKKEIAKAPVWTALTITEKIENAPSIDIEPKRGEWKNHKDEHYCTNCGEVVIGDWYDEDDWYTYCPNCGARMKGADDE